MKQHPTPPLSQRDKEILQAIIRRYTQDGRPVGSRTLAKSSSEHLSPATIRNIMADLEDLGLLTQPHASAGRVPTDLGYRYYVDQLLVPSGVAPEDQTAIERQLATGQGLSGLLEQTCKLLSAISSCVGFVSFPPLQKSIIHHIDFVRLSPRRVLAILVSPTGMIRNKTIELKDDLPQEALNQAANYLLAHYRGQTLMGARARLLALMEEEKARYDQLLQHCIELGTQSFAEDAEERTVLIDGAANILSEEQSRNIEQLKALYQAFEEKGALVKLINQFIETGGVSTAIGSELEQPEMADLALIGAQYWVGGHPLGTLGILGPTRMRYARMIALVSYVAQQFEQALQPREAE